MAGNGINIGFKIGNCELLPTVGKFVSDAVTISPCFPSLSR
jgi:hypothetical protein